MRHLVLAAVAVGALAAPALADVIRVPQDFGTIQGAVDAAFAGDKIIVSPGTYPENVTINTKPNLLIRGAGLVTINPATGPSILVVGSANTRIKKLSLVSTNSSGVVFLGSPDSLVAKCRAQGNAGFGALSSSGTRIVACRVNSTQSGIVFGGTGTHTAERCRVNSAAAGQAIIAGGETVNLIRCKVAYTGVPTMSPIESNATVRFFADRCRVQTAPTGGGIYAFDLQPADPGAQHELIRNRTEGCQIGIAGVSVNNVTATGNVITSTTTHGMAFNGNSLNLTRNKILLPPGPLFGIFAGNTTNTTISQNKIVGTGTGVFMNNGNGNTIAGNKLKNLAVGVTVSGNANTIGPDNKYRNVTTPISDGGVGTIILDTP